jgi:predicted  nucleic acid-binding Zn-ribbon protein
MMMIFSSQQAEVEKLKKTISDKTTFLDTDLVKQVETTENKLCNLQSELRKVSSQSSSVNAERRELSKVEASLEQKLCDADAKLERQTRLQTKERERIEECTKAIREEAADYVEASNKLDEELVSFANTTRNALVNASSASSSRKSKTGDFRKSFVSKRE